MESLEGRALTAALPGDGPVPVILWVDTRTMPADFDPVAVQARMRAVGAGVNVRIDVVPTGMPYETLEPGGVVLGPTPPSYRGMVVASGEPRIDHVAAWATWVPARMGVATWYNGNAIQVNPTTTAGSRTPDILYANILFHETFHHGVLGAHHTPLSIIPFETTPFSLSVADPDVPLVLTPAEITRLGAWLGRP